MKLCNDECDLTGHYNASAAKRRRRIIQHWMLPAATTKPAKNHRSGESSDN